MRSGVRRLIGMVGAMLLCAAAPQAGGPLEYELKAAILYNFLQFTEWPSQVGSTLNVCFIGQSAFESEVVALEGRRVGSRRIAVRRFTDAGPLQGCHIVIIAPSAMSGLRRALGELRGAPVLTVADSPGAAQRGVALNLAITQDGVTFEVNVGVARAAQLTISSKVLRLATDVFD
jgi:hypothetical protein